MSASASLGGSIRPASVITRDSLRSHDGGTWLRVTGDIDLATENEARAEVSALCEAGPPAVVLHSPDNAYVDVRGLAALVDAGRMLRARGGVLVVVNPPYSLRRMLQILDIR